MRSDQTIDEQIRHFMVFFMAKHAADFAVWRATNGKLLSAGALVRGDIPDAIRCKWVGERPGHGPYLCIGPADHPEGEHFIEKADP